MREVEADMNVPLEVDLNLISSKRTILPDTEEPSPGDEVNLDQSQEQDYGPDQDNPDPESTVEEYFAGHVDILFLTKRTCRNCRKIFSSGNLLHKHLRGKDCSKKHPVETHQSDQARQLSQAAVLKPTRSYFALLDTCESVKGYNIRKRPAPSQIGDGKVFRKFHYATCRASLSLNSVFEQICLDSGCTMTIGDREWIKKLRHQSVEQLSVCVAGKQGWGRLSMLSTFDKRKCVQP